MRFQDERTWKSQKDWAAIFARLVVIEEGKRTIVESLRNNKRRMNLRKSSLSRGFRRTEIISAQKQYCRQPREGQGNIDTVMYCTGFLRKRKEVHCDQCLWDRTMFGGFCRFPGVPIVPEDEYSYGVCTVTYSVCSSR